MFHSLDSLAVTLGLPRKWLKGEAEASRIPSLTIGRRRRFDLEAVRRALTENAQQCESSTKRDGVIRVSAQSGTGKPAEAAP